MLPVSPPTEMRRSFAMPVVTAAVRMELVVPVVVPEPSAIPVNPAHSETIEVRSPVPYLPPNKFIRTASGGLPPTTQYRRAGGGWASQQAEVQRDTEEQETAKG